MYIRTKRALLSRPVAAVLVGSLAMPTLSGCGGGGNTANIPPPVDATRGQAPTQPGANTRTGMSSNQKKMVMLAGAAALYYLYKKKQNAQGQTVQYYRSKNGRIYYRDPKTKQAIWVTPAQVRPIQVPADEAEYYRSYRGYNGNNQGRDLTNEIPLAPGGAY